MSEGEVTAGEGNGARGVNSGADAHLVCEWAEGMLCVKVESLSELAPDLQQLPAQAGLPLARAAPPEPSPPRHHSPHVAHTNREYRCEYCFRGFTFRTNCSRHEKVCAARVSKGPSYPFACQYCGAKYTRKYNLKVHLKKCSNSQNKPPMQQVHTQAGSPLARAAPPETSSTRHHSPHVAHTSVKVESLSEFASDLQQVPAQTGSRLARAAPRKSSSPRHHSPHVAHTNREYRCEYCFRGFTFRTNCSRHEKVCSARVSKGPSYPFACQYCGAKYTRKYNLNNHLKKCSNSQNKPPMQQVPAQAGPTRHHSPHVAHTNREYFCEYCFRRFSFRTNRSRHQKVCTARVSTGSSEPAFSCQYCGAFYTRKDNLNYHLKKCSNSQNKPPMQQVHTQAGSPLARAAPPEPSSPRHHSPHVAHTNREYRCEYCFRTNCSRHEKVCAARVSKDSSESAFTCQYCGAFFTRKGNLNYHLKKCSNSQNKPPMKKKKKSTPCFIEGCMQEFFRKTSLIEHLRSCHKEVKIHETVQKQFASIDEFTRWKDAEQETTFSYFSQKNGKGVSKVQYLYCQRDGSSKTPKKTSRCNKKGRVKVGEYCMANMKVWMSTENKVNVRYFPTHSHYCDPDDFKHHPLSTSVNLQINRELAAGHAPSKIWKDILATTQSANEEEAKKTKVSVLLTKKRIRGRARKLKERRKVLEDEANALSLLVNDLSKENDSVIIYKPYNQSTVIGPNAVDTLPDSDQLFMLGIQSRRQADLMAQHSQQIVIVDDTHGTNHHAFKLLTLMVVDENRKGWPVAHLITSKSDANTQRFFFQALKSKLPENIRINCVLTDDDPDLINAMELGFSQSLQHILCKWHLLKNFMENVTSKQDVPRHLKETMMNELRNIVNSKDEDVFKTLCDAFLAKYGVKSSGGSKFVEYFIKHYLHRSTKWAMCYRSNLPHMNVDTIGHVESFHNKLKTSYLKRKSNMRLDDLVNTLLEIERDDHIARIQLETVEMTYLPEDISTRHHRGMLLPDNITQVDEDIWEINGAQKDNTYIVNRYQKRCPDLCDSRCTEVSCAGLCAHMYSCSCTDDHPLCKHIHKVQSLISTEFIDTSNNYDVVTDIDNEGPTIASSSTIHETISKSSQDTKIREMLRNLQNNVSYLSDFMNNAEQNPEMLSHAVANTRELVLRMQLMRTVHTDIDSMDPILKYYSNDKLKTQLSKVAPFDRPLGKRKRVERDLSANKKNLHLHDSEEIRICNFTPPLSYASNPRDIILKCQSEKISLLNLKSLEVSLSADEVETCQTLDPIFSVGWLYPNIINAFLSKLSEQNPKCITFSTDLAIRASRSYTHVNAIKSRLEERNNDVNILLFPAKFSGENWIVVAVILGKKPEVQYYDPFQAPISPSTASLICQILNDMKSLFPTLSTWEKFNYVKMEKQTDTVNGGVYICSFAQQTVDLCEIYTHDDVHKFRKHIYCVIVGGCLKRKHFEDDVCRLCSVRHSDGTDERAPWISCEKCEQWFHVSCLRPSNTSKGIVCP